MKLRLGTNIIFIFIIYLVITSFYATAFALMNNKITYGKPVSGRDIDPKIVENSSYLQRALADGCDLIPRYTGTDTVWVSDCKHPPKTNFLYKSKESKQQKITHKDDEYSFIDYNGKERFIIPITTKEQEDFYLKKYNITPEVKVDPELIYEYILKNDLLENITVDRIPEKYENLSGDIIFHMTPEMKNIVMYHKGKLNYGNLSRTEKELLIKRNLYEIAFSKEIREAVIRQHNLSYILSNEQMIAIAGEYNLKPQHTLIVDNGITHEFGAPKEITDEDISRLRKEIEKDKTSKKRKFQLDDWQMTREELKRLLLPMGPRPIVQVLTFGFIKPEPMMASIIAS